MSPRPPLASTVAVSALVQGVGGGLGWSSMAASLPAFRAQSGASLLEGAAIWAAAALGIVAVSLLGGVVVERFGARRTGAVGLVVLPPLRSARGASPTLPALWLAVAVAANVLGSRWSDRLGLRRPFILGGAGLASASLVLLALGGPRELILLTAVGGGLIAPLIATLPLELPYAGAPALGAALGVVLVGGQLGGVLLPRLVGAALQHGGGEAALAVLAGAHLLILIPAGRLAETGASAPVPAAQMDFGGAAA